MVVYPPFITHEARNDDNTLQTIVLKGQFHDLRSDKNKEIYCRIDSALICLPADGEGEEPNNNLVYFVLKHIG